MPWVDFQEIWRTDKTTEWTRKKRVDWIVQVIYNMLWTIITTLLAVSWLKSEHEVENVTAQCEKKQPVTNNKTVPFQCGLADVCAVPYQVALVYTVWRGNHWE